MQSSVQRVAMRQKIQEAQWVILEEFLVWKELAALFDYVQTRELDFTTGRMSAAWDLKYADHRRSRVLLDESPLQAGNLPARQALSPVGLQGSRPRSVRRELDRVTDNSE